MSVTEPEPRTTEPDEYHPIGKIGRKETRTRISTHSKLAQPDTPNVTAMLNRRTRVESRCADFVLDLKMAYVIVDGQVFQLKRVTPDVSERVILRTMEYKNEHDVTTVAEVAPKSEEHEALDVEPDFLGEETVAETIARERMEATAAARTMTVPQPTFLGIEGAELGTVKDYSPPQSAPRKKAPPITDPLAVEKPWTQASRGERVDGR